MHYQRIVCDIDDTLSVTKNRDWENATPIQEVIDKLRQLYDLGWEIWLVTARGQLSCKGDLAKRELKYRGQIEAWLAKHHVPYHILSFEKPLATYYVDDKALSPEQFVNLKIEKITGGWSGARIELRDGRVYKTDPGSLQESIWYNVAERFFDTPHIYSIIGDTLCMEFIDTTGTYKIDELHNLIERFSKIPPVTGELDFSIYKAKIYEHCKAANNFEEIIPLMDQHRGIMENSQTFSHGDFSIENILVRDGVHYMIDPIHIPGENFSSFLLDGAKLLHSLRKHHRKVEYNYTIEFLRKFANTSKYFWYVLEACEWIRTYKYAPGDLRGRIGVEIHDLIGYAKNDRRLP